MGREGDKAGVPLAYGKSVGASDGCGTVVADRTSEYRRTLVSIASITVDWETGVVSAQEAMTQIAEVLRKSK